MTDLTEQWKKGELPEGHYYVKDGENIIAELLDGYFYNDGQPMTSFTGGVDEVIEQVPSYDEWKAKLEENAQLKEMLKEYKKQLSEIKDAYIDLTTQDEYGSYYIDEAKLFVEIVGKTIKDYDEPKIDNIIGEKK